jgi:hypothetical protein
MAEDGYLRGWQMVELASLTQDRAKRGNFGRAINR